MTGSGVCPSCLLPLGSHDAAARKRCHDAVSGYVRPVEGSAPWEPSLDLLEPQPSEGPPFALILMLVWIPILVAVLR